MSRISLRKGLFALSPIIVLLSVYLAASILAGSFYSIPISVAFIAASVYAVAISHGATLQERIDNFSRGAANSRIMYMIWIFVLAGAFASAARAMGAVDATVALTLEFIPVNYLPAGIFAAACFISMSIGTSVGTIVALSPVAAGLAEQLGCGVEWLVAIVVGGAFFGDNLSFISDTTIAATQTQGCSMRSKFRTNIILVMPAAVVTLLLYAFSGSEIASIDSAGVSLADAFKCVPYVVVIVAALFGVNVLVVLLVGIAVTGTMGLLYGSFSCIGLFTEISAGALSMSELIIVTMLAGGILEVVRLGGGIDFLVSIVTKRLDSRRGAEFSICALTALANVCTANNTIAILTVGGISHDISKRFGISPRRSASLLDTASCFVQGILPYGAQLLMAAGIAGISPLSIIPHLYYPMCVGAVLTLSIILGGKRKRRST